MFNTTTFVYHQCYTVHNHSHDSRKITPLWTCRLEWKLNLILSIWKTHIKHYLSHKNLGKENTPTSKCYGHTDWWRMYCHILYVQAKEKFLNDSKPAIFPILSQLRRSEGYHRRLLNTVATHTFVCLSAHNSQPMNQTTWKLCWEQLFAPSFFIQTTNFFDTNQPATHWFLLNLSQISSVLIQIQACLNLGHTCMFCKLWPKTMFYEKERKQKKNYSNKERWQLQQTAEISTKKRISPPWDRCCWAWVLPSELLGQLSSLPQLW